MAQIRCPSCDYLCSLECYVRHCSKFACHNKRCPDYRTIRLGGGFTSDGSFVFEETFGVMYFVGPEFLTPSHIICLWKYEIHPETQLKHLVLVVDRVDRRTGRISQRRISLVPFVCAESHSSRSRDREDARARYDDWRARNKAPAYADADAASQEKSRPRGSRVTEEQAPKRVYATRVTRKSGSETKEVFVGPGFEVEIEEVED